ncbi:hypothetical protein AGABI1DRAFT_84203 [Agaricus bisporus var. burnettii JB137-S8]|uniref:Pinin/SDK/MemA protein domain-containing protein n=1 Tax=Agaricus bisporus var. burnettii (strain JB137-S8 / ATCC MYA-4627 / FGSC 10392) TaxID=597362 RepID=K5XD73_AGABU|nr:uncharacterized protein AGABI1DRAFT_84203 [Agaricus bisporus var. burnettii JB137-S8]EKM81293.1 hypothetical protein AGABI1DRAFT_84203 [Agaricus bisporus var. burnettii JB137-S8]
MSSEDQPEGNTAAAVVDAPKPAPETRKRPRLDLSALDGGRERKRGKSMFGLVLGTLNKAKIEDKERNASEAAKKRQLIEQRLQIKLRKETDSVRRAEEAKKSKNTANRKEEDLQCKDSIHKLRRTRYPLLARFLLTSDTIVDDDSRPSSTNPLAPPPRSHPPPLYYLPAKLTSAQEAFLVKRKEEVAEAVEREWELFKEERTSGIEEINQLRNQATEDEAKLKSERVEAQDQETETDAKPPLPAEERPSSVPPSAALDANMDIDEPPTSKEEDSNSSPAKKEESAAMQADDDDAVEY